MNGDYNDHILKSEPMNIPEINNFKQIGQQVILKLHNYIGFDLGFLEENQFVTIAEDDKCCFCPFNSKAIQRRDEFVGQEMKFSSHSNCSCINALSRKELLSHIVEMAYGPSKSIDHLGALFYLKQYIDISYRPYIKDLVYHFVTMCRDDNNNTNVDSNNDTKDSLKNYKKSIKTVVKKKVVTEKITISSSSSDESSFSSCSLGNEEYHINFIESFVNKTLCTNEMPKLLDALQEILVLLGNTNFIRYKNAENKYIYIDSFFANLCKFFM